MLEFLTSTWGIVTISLVSAFLWFLLSILLYRVFFKRIYDILLSLLAILIFLPILLLLMLFGAIAMRGNPFFAQKRPGKNGKTFKMLKFRTMTNRRDKNGDLLPDEKRLTRYGRILRATSLDELPNILTIFSGKMSIIGPRPLLVSYLPLYNEFQAQRHKVRPGLTGLAQVSGRNAISWTQKFELDVKYVNGISFFGDLKIFFKTIFKVFKSEGISQDGNVTVEIFTGNENEVDVIENGLVQELISEDTEMMMSDNNTHEIEVDIIDDSGEEIENIELSDDKDIAIDDKEST